MTYKTIKISESLHQEIKKFCNEEGLKLNEWCERWLKSQLTVSKKNINLDKSFNGVISHESL